MDRAAHLDALLVKATSGEVSCGSEEQQGPHTTALENCVQDGKEIRKGETVANGAQGQDTSVPASQTLSPRPPSNATGSTPAHQESASLVIDPRSDSKPRSTNANQIRKALTLKEKRVGTRALVEKTREAFLLEMAIDTRKAG